MQTQDATLTHLRALEAEAIHIMREVAAEFDNPVMLYSIGKDSSVMLRLAMKAFAPGKLPFPLMHVDTTFKFREMYEFRDSLCENNDLDLIVHVNQDAVAAGINPFDHGSSKYTHAFKTEGLLQAMDKHAFDAAFGGARRTWNALGATAHIPVGRFFIFLIWMKKKTNKQKKKTKK